MALTELQIRNAKPGGKPYKLSDSGEHAPCRVERNRPRRGHMDHTRRQDENEAGAPCSPVAPVHRPVPGIAAHHRPGRLCLSINPHSIPPHVGKHDQRGLAAAGFTGDEMTAHGFRAMASTLLNESGRWNPDAIERALAHGDSDKVRAAYHRGAHWNERVEMGQWWSDYLDQLRKGAEIVPIRA